MRKKLGIMAVFLLGLLVGLFLIPELFRTFDIPFIRLFD